MPKNKNKNKPGWPQTSLQCQMIGNNELIPINVEGKGVYSKKSRPSNVGIYYEDNRKILSNMPALKRYIIHVPFLKNLFKDRLMLSRD